MHRTVFAAREIRDGYSQLCCSVLRKVSHCVKLLFTQCNPLKSQNRQNGFYDDDWIPKLPKIVGYCARNNSFS